MTDMCHYYRRQNNIQQSEVATCTRSQETHVDPTVGDSASDLRFSAADVGPSSDDVFNAPSLEFVHALKPSSCTGLLLRLRPGPLRPWRRLFPCLTAGSSQQHLIHGGTMPLYGFDETIRFCSDAATFRPH